MTNTFKLRVHQHLREKFYTIVKCSHAHILYEEPLHGDLTYLEVKFTDDDERLVFDALSKILAGTTFELTPKQPVAAGKILSHSPSLKVFIK